VCQGCKWDGTTWDGTDPIPSHWDFILVGWDWDSKIIIFMGWDGTLVRGWDGTGTSICGTAGWDKMGSFRPMGFFRPTGFFCPKEILFSNRLMKYVGYD